MNRRGEQPELEDAFRVGIKRCQQLGYNPSYFVRMLDEHGAVETARRLITASEPSEGFARLWELGHLELTVEAIVIQEPHAQHFSSRELVAARRRLESLGYEGEGMTA